MHSEREMRVKLSHTEWICVPTFSRLSTDSRCVSVGESLLACWKRGSGANTGFRSEPLPPWIDLNKTKETWLVKIFGSIVLFSGIFAC